MSLEPAAGPARLYSAVGADVNRHRQPAASGPPLNDGAAPSASREGDVNSEPASRRDRYVAVC